MATKVGNNGNSSSSHEDESMKDIESKKKSLKNISVDILNTYGELDLSKDLLKKINKTIDTVKSQPKDKALKALTSLEKDVVKRQSDFQKELAEVQARNKLVKAKLSSDEKKKLEAERQVLEATIEKWHKSTIKAMEDGKLGDMTGSKAIARDLKKDGYLMLPNKHTLVAYGFPTPKEAKELEEKLKLLGAQLNPKASKEKEQQLKKQEKDLAKLLEDISKIKDSVEKGKNLENAEEQNKGLENKAYLGRNFTISVNYRQNDSNGRVNHFTEKYIISGEKWLALDSKMLELKKNNTKPFDMAKILYNLFANSFDPVRSKEPVPFEAFNEIVGGTLGKSNGKIEGKYTPTAMLPEADVKDNTIEMSATDLEKERLEDQIENQLKRGDISSEEAKDLFEKLEQGGQEGKEEVVKAIESENEDNKANDGEDLSKKIADLGKVIDSGVKFDPEYVKGKEKTQEAVQKFGLFSNKKGPSNDIASQEDDYLTEEQFAEAMKRAQEFIEDGKKYSLARKRLEAQGITGMDLDDDTLEAEFHKVDAELKNKSFEELNKEADKQLKARKAKLEKERKAKAKKQKETSNSVENQNKMFDKDYVKGKELTEDTSQKYGLYSSKNEPSNDIASQEDDQLTDEQFAKAMEDAEEFIETGNMYSLARKRLEEQGIDYDDDILDQEVWKIEKEMKEKQAQKEKQVDQTSSAESVPEKIQQKELSEEELYSMARKNLESRGLSSMQIDDETLEIEVSNIKREMKSKQEQNQVLDSEEKNVSTKTTKGKGKKSTVSTISKEELEAVKKELNPTLNTKDVNVETDNEKQESDKTITDRPLNDNEKDGEFTLEDATVAPQKEKVIELPNQENTKDDNQEMTLDEAILKLAKEGKDVSDVIKFLDENEINDQPTRSAAISTFKGLIKGNEQGRNQESEAVGPELTKH